MISRTNPLVHMGQIVGAEARKLYATNPVILLPMGSQEDQGPHAPMGDYLLAEKIAELAALRASANGVRTVVAPVVAFGGADWFGAMPGGILSAWRQATLRPGEVSRSGGTLAAHAAVAWAQRVRKTQPEGGSLGLGGSPGSSSFRRRVPSSRGAAASSARV